MLGYRPDMRIIFMGTPDFAVPTLDALVTAGHEVVAVYTQPPRPAGRGKALSPSPVHRRADALGIAVRHPERLRGVEEQAAFAALGGDVAVVAAYGLILPQPILDAPRLGCINVHASLLPRWRGAAPVQRAILAGDVQTGVTIMQMEAGLDTGPMLARRATPVGVKTAGALTQELAAIGAALLLEAIAQPLIPVAQPDDGVTYAAKIDKAEARIDFARDAIEIERQVRAFAPMPGAWFEMAGERIRILTASVSLTKTSANAGVVIDDNLTVACGTGALAPTLVQRAGRSAMSPHELLRGFPILPGTRLA